MIITRALALTWFGLLLFIHPSWAATPQGKVTGGMQYTIPSWFKQSLLDFQEDVAEARDNGRHLMVFMHLDECPYCAKVIKENFLGGENTDYFRQRFDVVAVNIRGNLEVTWVDGNTYTERDLRKKMGVFATPTIVFLSQQGDQVLTLPGYRNPQALRMAADYIHEKQYQNSNFATYLAGLKRPEVYQFKDHPQFEFATFLKGTGKPLMVLLEDKYCGECAQFHETTLNHPEILEAMKPFLVVRLDAESKSMLVTPDGRRTTPADWVRELGLTYRPALVLFDGERQLYQADGRLYHQHLLEALTYVSGGHDKNYPSLSAYKRDFRQKRLQEGKDVDFGE